MKHASSNLLFSAAVLLVLSTLPISALAEDEKKALGNLLRMDGKIVSVPDAPAREESAASRSLDESAKDNFIKQRLLSGDFKDGDTPEVSPPQAADPDNPDLFELPQGERIVGCSYSAGATFPDRCTDDSDNLVFEAGREPQSVLDEMMKKQGIVSTYNIVPKGYSAQPVDE
jgi:hypothetical protein